MIFGVLCGVRIVTDKALQSNSQAPNEALSVLRTCSDPDNGASEMAGNILKR
jgi:hypothetical protein